MLFRGEEYMKPKIKEEQFEEIANLYLQGYSIRKLEEKYGVSNSAISRVLRVLDIKARDNSHKGRKYTIDENYFDEINTPNKAYILGLLYADGCNHRKTNHVNLELQDRDVNILLKIKEELKTNRPLYYNELHKRNQNWRNTYRLTISNKHMSEVLEEKGMPSNKSLKLEFPTFLDIELYSHFIRGYFDGDGCILWEYGKPHCANIASTLSFCKGLQEILNERKINSVIRNTQNKDTSTRVLYLTSKDNIYAFLDYIYKDAELYIERKYDKYLIAKNEMKQLNRSLLA